jgi:hypothetical protein
VSRGHDGDGEATRAPGLHIELAEHASWSSSDWDPCRLVRLGGPIRRRRAREINEPSICARRDRRDSNSRAAHVANLRDQFLTDSHDAVGPFVWAPLGQNWPISSCFHTGDNGGLVCEYFDHHILFRFATLRFQKYDQAFSGYTSGDKDAGDKGGSAC